MKKSKCIYWLRRIVIFFLLLSSFLFTASAQSIEPYLIVQDLEQDWLIYDEKKNEFTPFAKEISNPTDLHFSLNLKAYSDFHLALSIPENAALFIENKIVDYFETRSTKYLSIDSLKVKYEKDTILITVFSENNLFLNLKTIVVDFSPSVGYEESTVEFQSEFRFQNQYINFNILSVLIIFIIGTIVRVYQGSVFGEYLDFRKILSSKPKSDVLYSTSILSLQNLSFLFLFGITMGFSICNLMIWTMPDIVLDFGFSNTIGIISIALLFSLGFMFLMILKYPLINFIASIFLFRKLKAVHYYENLRFGFFVAFIFLVISMLNNYTDGKLLFDHIEIITGLVIVMLVANSILVFIKLNNLQSFRKLHLFSYLCSTEIIPLIILLKIFTTYI